jgi:AhpD family alkylhydroperoxidase
MPEPLLSRLAPEALPEDFQRLRAASIDVAGDGVRLEVFGHHPAIYRFYQRTFYGAFFDNDGGDMVADRKWKELIRLKLSLTNGCFVCNAHNVPGALAAGYTREQIDAMGDSDSPLFTPQEQAVLALGALFAIRETDPRLTPELYARLSAHFSDAEILELGFFATIVSGWTKLVFAYDLITRECAIDDAGRETTPSRTHLKAAPASSRSGSG